MPRSRTFSRLAPLGLFPSLVAVLAGACSATSTPPGQTSAGTGGSGTTSTGQGGDLIDASSGTGGGGEPVQDPKTCAEAAANRTYVGCDFWPTVVDNVVRKDFDYAVVVANAGDEPASVTVTRNGAMLASVDVAPTSLQTIYLPWVEELKATTSILACTPTDVKTATVDAKGGAYHLVATRPVTVYQFNAIEYAGKGGPPGKDWTECMKPCLPGVGCFSYTNDASLLLPSTALTGTFRITGESSWADPDNSFEYPPYIAVTGLSNGTSVTVKLSSTASVAGGSGIQGAGPGGTVTFALAQGEVVELVGGMGSDLSGSLVTASAPVQVIAGISCSYIPHDSPACDHLEESVLPAETLGKHYFVTRPTGPHGTPVGHVVRLYGNVDGTNLTYPGKNPGGPSTIQAGEMVDLGIVNDDFEIVGDHELSVGTFMTGASLADPGIPLDQQKGDPSQSQAVTVEQFRKKYVFLAPSDYDISFVDVVAPNGTTLTLDGQTVSAPPSDLGSGYGVARVQLGPGNGGAHVLLASAPVGIQVMGYGTYTSYQYPGGLNLTAISPPPPK
ncbi:MAG: IgGFc-binding protein [Byssovorax sp.]